MLVMESLFLDNLKKKASLAIERKILMSLAYRRYMVRAKM